MSERQDELHDTEQTEEDQDSGQDSSQDSGQDPGQVSEVQQLGGDGAETPIAPGDSVAGYPDSESGDADTQGAGPDGVPPENRRDNEFGPAE